MASLISSTLTFAHLDLLRLFCNKLGWHQMNKLRTRWWELLESSLLIETADRKLGEPNRASEAGRWRALLGLLWKLGASWDPVPSPCLLWLFRTVA